MVGESWLRFNPEHSISPFGERRHYVRRTALVFLLLLLVEVPAQPAAAHPTNRFRACTKQPAGECLNVGAEIFWGATAILKGKVRPRHAGVTADVLRRNPRGHV